MAPRPLDSSFSIRIEEKWRRLLDSLARELGVSRSDLVRIFCKAIDGDRHAFYAFLLVRAYHHKNRELALHALRNLHPSRDPAITAIAEKVKKWLGLKKDLR